MWFVSDNPDVIASDRDPFRAICDAHFPTADPTDDDNKKSRV
jgi:hypothetical protein